MICISKHPGTRPFKRLAQCLSGLALLLAIVAGAGAQGQSGGGAIYGVTTFDVAPGAANEGVALARQYRDGARKQAGNMGVTALQEASWPNRFVIYETWKDQAAYDANDKAAHSAELRDKLKSIGGAPYDPRDYHVISVGPAEAAAGSGTIYNQLHLDVFPPRLEPCLAAAKALG